MAYTLPKSITNKGHGGHKGGYGPKYYGYGGYKTGYGGYRGYRYPYPYPYPYSTYAPYGVSYYYDACPVGTQTLCSPSAWGPTNCVCLPF